jgi:superfamily II DNA/RNA helicase
MYSTSCHIGLNNTSKRPLLTIASRELDLKLGKSVFLLSMTSCVHGLNLLQLKFNEMTDIQLASIPHALAGR